MNNTRILVTGSTGFIGRSLLLQLKARNYELTASIRKQTNDLPIEIKQVKVGDLLPETDWVNAISGVEIIIHLAARVHVMDEKDTNPLVAFRNTNTAGTLHLAREAAKAGVRRFIFLSSIKVNGENTNTKPFNSAEINVPNDPYGLSKYEAEEGLKKISEDTGMEIVIIRPPLVYGPGVKANFLNMIRYLHKGFPLPLGAIHNQRSLVSVDNLIDLIITCIDHPAAANEIFLVSDDEDLSTTQLLKRMAMALEKPTCLVPIPSNMIFFVAKILGKSDVAQRLCGSLQVDISHTKKTLNWKPPFNIDRSLKKTAQAYLNEKNI